MNDTVKKFADKAKTRTEALTAEFNEKAKEAMAKSSKLAEEAVEFNKANLEALVESGKIAAKNLETLGQEGVAFARKSFEDTTAAMKGYTAVKSPAEFFKLYAENSKKARTEEHKSELQSLRRISYAAFCWKKKRNANNSQDT